MRFPGFAASLGMQRIPSTGLHSVTRPELLEKNAGFGGRVDALSRPRQKGQSTPRWLKGVEPRALDPRKAAMLLLAPGSRLPSHLGGSAFG